MRRKDRGRMVADLLLDTTLQILQILRRFRNRGVESSHLTGHIVFANRSTRDQYRRCAGTHKCGSTGGTSNGHLAEDHR